MVYLFLSDGFEEIEAITVVDILRRANIKVKIVAIKQKENTGAHGVKIIADEIIDNISFDDIEMVILPGGMPGTLNLQKSEKLQNLIKHCIKANKKIAAICAAPIILGLNGYLKNKNVTCYPGFEDKLTCANVIKTPYITDKNITTANGPGSAAKFALEIVKILKGENLSKNIKSEMLF